MATKAKVTKAAPKSAPKAAPKKSAPTQSASGKSKTPVKAAPKKTQGKSLSHEEIARQAFMLWQERGGSEMENWLEAERQLH